MMYGCAAVPPPTSVPSPASPAVPKQLQERQVLVTLAAALQPQWASIAGHLMDTYGLAQTGAFPLLSLGVQCIVLQIPPERSIAETLQRLAADPRVESVQHNQVFQGLTTTRNDPYASLQHGAQAMQMDAAHRWATGKGIAVAVVDTGVDTEHPDLRGRIVRTVNFVDGGEQTFAQDHHGTAVAGVIGASAHNATGIVGIAPEADLVAVKACWHPTPAAREASCSSWSLAKALDYVIIQQLHVVNLSLTGPPDRLLARLIHRAVAERIVVIAAVREADQTWGFPASMEPVIAVAVYGRPLLSRLVGGRQTTPLQAPGDEIVTTVPPDAYDFLSGSSLAAAHVSGLAALLLERDPTLTPAHLQTILRTASQPLSRSVSPAPAPMGLVNACHALAQVLAGPGCP